jgi:hypothetical protein
MSGEVLGRITVPGGVLVVGDMGYLGDWSGDAAPGIPRDLPPDLADVAAKAVDWRIVGPDAEAAARTFDRQPLTFLYDMPDEQHLHELWRDALDGTGLAAALSMESRRVPHRDRARRAGHAGGSGFFVNGVPFVAVPVAAPGPFEVVGHRSAEDPYAWRDVELVLSSSEPTATRRLGHVGVDWARLVMADVDALSDWVHEDSLDGQADVAFWGRDAAKAAKRFKPARLDEGGQEVHGWENLPMADATDLAVKVDDWRAKKGRGLAVDFRPHSHHYRVMRQVRSSETESGVIEVGGADVLGFMTTWGDGFFDVELDSDADGRPVIVRIIFER